MNPVQYLLDITVVIARLTCEQQECFARPDHRCVYSSAGDLILIGLSISICIRSIRNTVIQSMLPFNRCPRGLCVWMWGQLMQKVTKDVGRVHTCSGREPDSRVPCARVRFVSTRDKNWPAAIGSRPVKLKRRVHMATGTRPVLA